MQITFRQRIIIFIIALAFFIEILDTTIINTSIPQIAESFNVPSLTIKIAITSYLIALAIFIPVSGWLADTYGAKKIFQLAIAIFTLSSLFCGLASSIYELALFRFTQGIGGAFMIPIGRLIVLQVFSNQDLLKVMSSISIIALFGLVLGPLVGGYITTYYSWHWIFFINIPLGLLEFFLATKFIEQSSPLAKYKLDIKGFVLIALGLALVAFSAENITEKLLPTFAIIFLFFLGITLIIFYIMHARKIAQPILKLSLFFNKTFRIANILLFITIFAAGGVSFILPILFQTQFNLSPLYSGLFTALIAIGAIGVRPFIPTLTKNFGYKKLVQLNSLFLSCCLLFFFFLSELNYLAIIVLGIFYGVFYTIQLSSAVVIGYLSIEATEKSAATTLQSTNQQFAMSLCICLNAILIYHFSEYFSNSTNRSANILAFQYTFLVLALLSLTNIFNLRKLNI